MPNRPRVAVVDDEAIVRREVGRGLSKEDLVVEAFADGESLLERLSEVTFDLVLCDLRLPGMDGLQVLKAVQQQEPVTELIIITGHGSVDAAIEAIQNGAFHFVTKPLKMAELRPLVRRALEKVALVREKDALKKELLSRTSSSGIIGHSKPMQQVFDLIDKVAPLDCNVLIQGESGTGK